MLVCWELSIPRRLPSWTCPHTVLAELELEAVLSGRVPAFEDISRFPETRRDIAVVVGRDVPAAALTRPWQR